MLVSFLESLIVFCIGIHVALSVNFLAVGDWGGREFEPFYTPGQAASVVGMDRIATSLKAEFVLAVGDNFYHHGVEDEFDSRFQTSFENVYSPASLQCPWYAVFGNHDYNGNATAQMAYAAHSQRWKFPSNYYSKSFASEDGSSLDIIFIDTVELADMTTKEEDEEGYFDPLPLKARDYASDQWNWIEQQMQASKADHLLVVGHYPVYSACRHGNTDTLISYLRPLLEQYNAQYLNGHDHCMEHISEVGSKVNHFLVGMGSFCCYKLSNEKKIPKKSLRWHIASDNREEAQSGFASFEVSKSGMNVKYYDQDGTLLYAVPTILSRSVSV